MDSPHHAAGPAARAVRFMTLAEARALECNGCGDCCDSTRTEGFWTWGRLPSDQYRPMFGGRPLIIPIERSGAGWRDRPLDVEDAAELTATRFRCAAFQPRPDGTGRCGLHDAERPSKCVEFPVGGEAIERELLERGESWLETGAFPRCTWYRVCVVSDGDPRLPDREGDPVCAP